jgi:hypothetical protein
MSLALALTAPARAQVEMGLVSDVPSLIAAGVAGSDVYSESRAPEGVQGKQKFLG